MQSPSEDVHQSPTEWGQIRRQVEQLEKAWQSGTLVELTLFLPPPGDSLRRPTLQALIKAELGIRWRRGEKVPLEQYLERFPELGGRSNLSPSLIYDEFCVRQQCGDKPDLKLYQARFPQQYDEVQVLVASQPPLSHHSLETPWADGPTPAAGASQRPPSPHSLSPPAQLEPTVPPPALGADGGAIQLGGKYKLIRRIGRGTYGEVWRAEAPGGIPVAVKQIFRPLSHEDAQRELQALELIRQLSHPFLLATQSFEPRSDQLYIVMELADSSLRDRLRECRQQGQTGIAADELVGYIREAAEALDYLHSLDLQHRDIKPDNILLLKRHAKVADFGLARLVPQSQRSVMVSGCGTPAYMAPEVWRNKVTRHSDQYSLAATYAELRLGRALFSNHNMYEVMLAHLNEAPDLTALGPGERQVLLRALSKDPSQRYGSCSEFAEALQAELSGSKNSGTRWVTSGPGYKLLHPLGGDGYRGEVWEGSAPDGQRVSVTVISKLKYAAAKEEMDGFGLIRSLEHRHVGKLLDCWLVDRSGKVVQTDSPEVLDPSAAVTLFLAGERPDETLGQRLERHLKQTSQGLPEEELLRWMRQAAEALDYLNLFPHQLGDRLVAIRHCGVSPENLQVVGGTVKLREFALAKVVQGTTTEIRGEESGNYSPEYTAPELFRKRVTSTTDQYSLAVTYFHLRLGVLPYDQSKSSYEIIQLHLDGRLDLNRLPPLERQVVGRATALDPEERFPSCLDMVAALEQACQEGRGQGHDLYATMSAGVPIPPAPPPESPSSRRTAVRPEPNYTARVPDVAVAEDPASSKTVMVPAAQAPSLSPERLENAIFETLRHEEDEATDVARPDATQRTSPSLGGKPDLRPVPLESLPGWQELTAPSLSAVKPASSRNKPIPAAPPAAAAEASQESTITEAKPGVKPALARTPFQQDTQVKVVVGRRRVKVIVSLAIALAVMLGAAAAFLLPGPNKPSDPPVDNRKERHEALTAEARQQVQAGKWEEALETAKLLRTECQDAEAAGSVEEEALRVGRTQRGKALERAQGLSPLKAREFYQRAVRISGTLEEHGAAKKGELTDEVLKVWVARGQQALKANASQAKAVADHVLAEAPTEPDALKLRTDARAALEGTEKAEGCVGTFAKEAAVGNAAGAIAALTDLKSQLPRLSPDQQNSVLTSLGTKAEAILALAYRATDTGAVGAVLDALDQEPLKVADWGLELTLARAALHVRGKKYDEFFRVLNQAARAAAASADDDAKKLVSVSVKHAAKVSAADKDIPSPHAQALLDRFGELASAARDEEKDAYCALVGVVVKDLYPGLGVKETISYGKLRQYCQNAVDLETADLLIRACLAECLILRKNPKLLDPVPSEDLGEASRLVGNNAGPSKGEADVSYVRFVRGLLTQAAYETPAITASHYEAAYNNRFAWQNKARNELAASAFFKAAIDRKVNDPTTLAWFRRANDLHPPPALLEYRLRLAACAHAMEAWPECEKVTSSLLKEELSALGSETYTVMVQNARSRAETGNKAGALDRYLELLDDFFDEKKWVKAPAQEVESALVRKAIDVGKELLQTGPTSRQDALDRTRVAKAYAFRGRIICDNPHVSWKLDARDCFAVAAEAFQTAISLVPENDALLQEYHMRRGFALAEFKLPDLEEIGREAEAALRPNRRYPGGLALQAHYLYLKSTSRWGLALDMLQEAVGRFREAIDATGAGGPRRDKKLVAGWHTTCSIAYVRLANARVDPTGKRDRTRLAQDLKEAVTHARKGTAQDENSQRAWWALGNVLEDLAWSELGNQPGSYEEAAEAFRKAKSIPPTTAETSVGLARCLIKWTEDNPRGGKNALHLTEAQAALGEALTLEPGHAEACYWQGKLLLQQKKKAAALEVFARALSNPRHGLTWYPSINQAINENSADWQTIFDNVLGGNPANYGAEQALCLYIRAEFQSRDRDAVLRQLDGNNPPLLADVDRAGQLAMNPTVKALANKMAANLRTAARTRNPAKNDEYWHQAMDDMRRVVKSDPSIWEGWWIAQSLAKDLEYLARIAGPGAKKVEHLDEAIQVMDRAIQVAPQDKKDGLIKYRSHLEQMRKDP